MTDSLATIACAGAGTLGSAIMRRLIDVGHPVLVWNRSSARLAPLINAGATAVDSPADLARGADLIITCVVDGKAVEATVFGDDGIATAARDTDCSNKLLIDMSTIAAPHKLNKT